MQTFLSSNDIDYLDAEDLRDGSVIYAESAFHLDKLRLGKQRVETYQIMQVLVKHRLITGEEVHTGRFLTHYYDLDTGDRVFKKDMRPEIEYRAEKHEVIKYIPWPKEKWEIVPYEPKGWAHHPAVLMWEGHTWALLQYQKAVCSEWVERGNKDGTYEKTEFLYFATAKPGECQFPPVWLGDPALHISHQSNLVRKDPGYYKPLFPGVPDNLEYVWPKPTDPHAHQENTWLRKK